MVVVVVQGPARVRLDRALPRAPGPPAVVQTHPWSRGPRAAEQSRRLTGIPAAAPGAAPCLCRAPRTGTPRFYVAGAAVAAFATDVPRNGGGRAGRGEAAGGRGGRSVTRSGAAGLAAPAPTGIWGPPAATGTALRVAVWGLRSSVTFSSNVLDARCLLWLLKGATLR